MKLTDRWTPGNAPSLSFEFFPARTEKARTNQLFAMGKAVEVQPDFVSVTFGAGGSTRQGSRLLVEALQDRSLEVLAYFSCYGLGPRDILGALGDYRELGVDNVLAVRGDIPRDDPGFAPHPDALPHASDLLSFMGQHFDFCVGAAGYPEGHVEAESLERDLDFLKLKVERGARFVITNYTYDNRHYFDFVERARAAGIQVPIVPGVMPIFSVKMMRNLARLCGASIPAELDAGLAALPDNPKEVLDFGVEYAIRACAELLDAGVPGLHFYTMNRMKGPARIVAALRGDGLL